MKYLVVLIFLLSSSLSAQTLSGDEDFCEVLNVILVLGDRDFLNAKDKPIDGTAKALIGDVWSTRLQLPGSTDNFIREGLGLVEFHSVFLQRTTLGDAIVNDHTLLKEQVKLCLGSDWDMTMINPFNENNLVQYVLFSNRKQKMEIEVKLKKVRKFYRLEIVFSDLG